MADEQQNKHWYALYTKPRWEKKVYDLIQRRGVEGYCPMNKVRKKWTDRFKVIEEPLFKSYLFVRVDEQEKGVVRYVDGVVNYVYWLGKPAIIREDDIERIKRFLNEYSDVKVEQIGQPQPGDKVLITGGVFMEQEGTVLATDKKRVEILIESLGCKLVAQVDKDKVTVRKG
ncbi:UpxY family transcription antiterminator [Flavihumibacter fluvii]|uniref:UpxY family transcription antiterminator n=1 Tax=Flavihumibacter fluvii TaxID=2838157 RepID=UPI001BDEC5EA|nr:UpxY family transcription antiterminator [Flavihumibacter fluvii]ULQ52388.1 UpxY family transcription antiterminator [Flavihumibacter fluvii]